MRHLRGLLLVWLACVLFIAGLSGSAAQAQAVWQVGALVGLRAGTCIREGPGFAYRAHTRVPEDNWTVMVIDGPRFADGHTWWDISRRAAGDPSGGTGWVTQDQTDTDCPWPMPIAERQIARRLPVTTPESGLLSIGRLWYQLPAWAQWLVAAAVLLVGMRVVGRLVGWIMELLGSLLVGSIIWLFMEYTRAYWGPFWNALAPQIFPQGAPDLALLLAALPVLGWLLSLLRRLAR